MSSVMTECTVCLHCHVSGWEYQRDVSDGATSADERCISLFGEVEHRGFTKRMPFDLRLVSGLQASNIPELSETNVLEINEAMPEHAFPEHISALIPVAETQLEDLRACLLQSVANEAMSLSVTLVVAGLRKLRHDNDCILPVEGCKMNITSFSWKLAYAGRREVGG